MTNEELAEQYRVELRARMVDINGAKFGVQVEINDDGKVLWVSVDGQTVLRICNIPCIEVEDHRTSPLTKKEVDPGKCPPVEEDLAFTSLPTDPERARNFGKTIFDH